MAGKKTSLSNGQVLPFNGASERSASVMVTEPNGLVEEELDDEQIEKINSIKKSVSSLPSFKSVDLAERVSDLKPRKSSFQITSVTNSREGDDNENIEDTDETANINGTTKDSSQIVTHSKLDQGNAVKVMTSTGAIHHQGLGEHSTGVPSVPSVSPQPVTLSPSTLLSSPDRASADIHSRFKLVKIISRIRGRWKCLEFAGLPSLDTAVRETRSDCGDHANNRTNALPEICRVDNPILYVTGSTNASINPLQTLVCGADGRLVQLDANPNFHGLSEMIASWPATTQVIALDDQESMASQDVVTLGDFILPSNTGLQKGSEVNRVKSDPAFMLTLRESVPLNEDEYRTPLGSAVFDNIIPSRDGDIGAAVDSSGESLFALDNKIEQAMDLVKSHLMFAVHEEVELLKEQIKELTIKNAQLEIENTVLRAGASSQTLAMIQQPRPSLSELT